MLPRREPDRRIPRMDLVRKRSFGHRFLRACPIWFGLHPLGVGAAVLAGGALVAHAPLVAAVFALAAALSLVTILAARALDRAFGAHSRAAAAGWSGLNLILLAFVIVAHRAWVEPAIAADDALCAGFLRTWGATTVAPCTELVALGFGALLVAMAFLPPGRLRPAAAGPAGPAAPPPPTPPEAPSPAPVPAPIRPRAGAAAAEAECAH